VTDAEIGQPLVKGLKRGIESGCILVNEDLPMIPGDNPLILACAKRLNPSAKLPVTVRISFSCLCDEAYCVGIKDTSD